MLKGLAGVGGGRGREEGTRARGLRATAYMNPNSFNPTPLTQNNCTLQNWFMMFLLSYKQQAAPG